MAIRALRTVTTLPKIELAGVGDDGLDTGDVVAQAALDLAGAGAREERELHALQVAEQPVAQVAHHRVAEPGRQVRLPDADGSPDQRDGHADGDQRGQQSETGLPDALADAGEQRAVEDGLREEGEREPQQAADQDRPHDDRDASPVGAEQRDDAAPGAVGIAGSGRRRAQREAWRPGAHLSPTARR
jgi:hypothetical protein